MRPVLTGPVLELLARFGGTVPVVQPDWATAADPAEMITVAVMGLDAQVREMFLAEFQRPGWETLVVLNSGHPSLEAICEWVEGEEDRVLMVASPSGPAPPQVAVLTRELP